MIFYFNRHTLWKYCNFIYNAWKIYVFNKKKFGAGIILFSTFATELNIFEILWIWR